MNTRLKFTVYLVIASALALVFGTSCGTVRGFGRDVERVGDGIERSAR